MKALNLDSLASPKRLVTLNGSEYEVKQMSVTDFVAAAQEAKKFEGKTPDFAENIEAAIRSIGRAMPGLTEEKIRALSLEQIGALVNFLNGEYDEELKKGIEVAAETGDKGKSQTE